MTRPAHRRHTEPSPRRGSVRVTVVGAVAAAANRRCDGVLPTDVPGVGDVFADDLDLVGALQLRWHTRLAGTVEQALAADAGDPESAVIAAWRRTAADLPGVRAVLDARLGRPASERERAALRAATVKDRVLLAAMAGLAAPGDPAAESLGQKLEEEARAGLRLAA